MNHSKGEYVREDVHTICVESFWALLKRAYYGTFHWMSPKHLHRYVNEFTGRHNICSLSTLKRIGTVLVGGEGQRLTYKDLIAP